VWDPICEPKALAFSLWPTGPVSDRHRYATDAAADFYDRSCRIAGVGRPVWQVGTDRTSAKWRTEVTLHLAADAGGEYAGDLWPARTGRGC
jgi:hypothetical protein